MESQIIPLPPQLGLSIGENFAQDFSAIVGSTTGLISAVRPQPQQQQPTTTTTSISPAEMQARIAAQTAATSGRTSSMNRNIYIGFGIVALFIVIVLIAVLAGGKKKKPARRRARKLNGVGSTTREKVNNATKPSGAKPLVKTKKIKAVVLQ